MREYAMERRGYRTFLRREVDIARRQGQPVLFAHDRHTDNSNREIEILGELRDHLELLIILLAEQREIRLALDQQLGDHRGNTGEEMRAEGILQSGCRRPFRYDLGRETAWIHHFSRRCPDQVGLFSREYRKV